MALLAGTISRELGDNDGARADFLNALGVEGSASAREAATQLLRLGGLTADQRLAIADVDARHGNATRAAETSGTRVGSKFCPGFKPILASA